MNELDEYNYHLPPERIAQHPLTRRSDARLMIVNRSSGEIEHSHVRDLARYLHPGDMLVLNNSRVIPAKLVGYREQTRGRWQGLFLRSDESSGVWELLTKTRGKLQAGELLMIQDRTGRDCLRLRCIARTDEGHLLAAPEAIDGHELQTDPLACLEAIGRIPLPHYIRDGQMVDADLEDYQTVYAKTAGSIAAPTAGLHFTPALLQALKRRDLSIAEVTLHVGLGTFQPIESTTLDGHQMHYELGEIDEATCDRINASRRAGGRTVAVGTTSVRVLETAANRHQGQLTAWHGETNLFIRPGYRFQAVDGLLTNFHLPKSTLVVLVSAFAGKQLTLRAYQEAIEEEYRFFSYGDAMLIL